MEGVEFEFVGVLVVIVSRLVTKVVGRVSSLLVVGRVSSVFVVGVVKVVGRVSSVFVVGVLKFVGRVSSVFVVGVLIVVGRVVGEDTEPMGLLLQPAGAFTLQTLYRVLGRYAPASPEMKSW